MCAFRPLWSQKINQKSSHDKNQDNSLLSNAKVTEASEVPVPTRPWQESILRYLMAKKDDDRKRWSLAIIQTLDTEDDFFYSLHFEMAQYLGQHLVSYRNSGLSPLSNNSDHEDNHCIDPSKNFSKDSFDSVHGISGKINSRLHKPKSLLTHYSQLINDISSIFELLSIVQLHFTTQLRNRCTKRSLRIALHHGPVSLFESTLRRHCAGHPLRLAALWKIIRYYVHALKPVPPFVMHLFIRIYLTGPSSLQLATPGPHGPL